jgi:hypothetical protein
MDKPFATSGYRISFTANNVLPHSGYCRDDLLPPENLGCSLEWGGKCLSSLPCKYKGLCADAPITEQEV